MGDKAEVPDAHESWGKHVEQEAAQELVDRKGHQALLVAMGRVSPAKGDLATLQGDEAVIGDGHPVGVAAEIVENMLRAAEGPFAVDHPVLVKQLPQERGENFGLGEKFEITVETELTLGEGTPATGNELASKDAT
jgi:hypothetical protein